MSDIPAVSLRADVLKIWIHRFDGNPVTVSEMADWIEIGRSSIARALNDLSPHHATRHDSATTALEYRLTNKGLAEANRLAGVDATEPEPETDPKSEPSIAESATYATEEPRSDGTRYVNLTLNMRTGAVMLSWSDLVELLSDN